MTNRIHVWMYVPSQTTISVSDMSSQEADSQILPFPLLIKLNIYRLSGKLGIAPTNIISTLEPKSFSMLNGEC